MLRDLQTAAGKTKGKVPRAPIKTCWSAQVLAINSQNHRNFTLQVFVTDDLIQLQGFVRHLLPNSPSLADWTTMEKAVERIEVVVDATLDVESDHTTFATVPGDHSLFVHSRQCFLHQHLARIKAHWSNQTDFGTFQTPALIAQEAPLSKHFFFP